METSSWYSKFFVLMQTLVVLGLGACGSWFFANTVFENEKQALVGRIYNVAKTLDAGVLSDLSGAGNDLEKPSYTYLKKKLVDLKSINPDARFFYIMGYRKDINKLFFYVDSESPSDSRSYSPPGQVYDESTNVEINNFLQGIAFAEGPYTDAWGKWVSAYAPVFSERTGLPIAIVGLDVDATKMIRDIAYAASFPMIISFILAGLLYIFHKMRTREKMNELNNVKLEFTSFMSHEIRGFVTKIKGGLQALVHEDFGILTPDQSVYVNDLIGQSDEFGALIEEFLDIGHLEQDSEIELKKSDFNLLDILKNVIGDTKDFIDKKNITVIYEGDIPEKIYCFCDNNKIGRVFSNIILNAVKYSPDKTSIHIGYFDSNAAHTIYIKDNGIGIPESEKGKMFKKFFRASNARDAHSSGTGLGLYFSKLIIDKHGGKIWYESSEGRGTTFFVSLPKK